MAKQLQKRQDEGAVVARSQGTGPDAPVDRPYVVRLEWRRETLYGERALWMVLSDGSAELVREALG